MLLMNPNKNRESGEEDSHPSLLPLMQAANKVAEGCHAVHTMLIKEAEETETGVSDDKNKGRIFLDALENRYQNMMSLQNTVAKSMAEDNKEELKRLMNESRDRYRKKMAHLLGVLTIKHADWDQDLITDMLTIVTEWEKRAIYANLIMRVVGRNSEVLQAFRDSLPQTQLDDTDESGE